MSTTPYSVRDFYPRYLNQKEISAPWIFFYTLFSAESLSELLEELQTWHSFVLQELPFNSQRQNNPMEIFYIYSISLQLSEASFLLTLCRQHRQKDDRAWPVQDRQLLQEQQEWPDFPKGFSREELLDPYLVLENYFKAYSLPEYRRQLHLWLEKALSWFTADDDLPESAVSQVYENLKKLYCAAWLIRQRETKPILNQKEDIKKTENTQGTAKTELKTTVNN